MSLPYHLHKLWKQNDNNKKSNIHDSTWLVRGTSIKVINKWNWHPYFALRTTERMPTAICVLLFHDCYLLRPENCLYRCLNHSENFGSNKFDTNAHTTCYQLASTKAQKVSSKMSDSTILCFILHDPRKFKRIPGAFTYSMRILKSPICHTVDLLDILFIFLYLIASPTNNSDK